MFNYDSSRLSYSGSRLVIIRVVDFPTSFSVCSDGNYTSMSICAKLLQLSPTLCDSMDYSPEGSSVHGILQARILEWVAMPSSRGSSWSRDRTTSTYIAGRFFTTESPSQGTHFAGRSSLGSLAEWDLTSLWLPFPAAAGTAAPLGSQGSGQVVTLEVVSNLVTYSPPRWELGPGGLTLTGH